MAKVAVLFKIYAEEGKEAEVSKLIHEQLKPTAMQMEEVGYGIKIIKAMFVYEDEQGSSRIEDSLRKVSGVREVEVAEESLV
ncbi:MAG: hypothetical protein KGH61_02100 [Candidatus Micrarchaeota archaeon]|nr:hypothetical protein [Candidatus Micrarchaeota archaeon]MDE1847723.1 hypothetical protein [Candidatus Micrarchaeota archaeon]MDE1864152.1 hypothetical protein [Candidatus Micrarchaeota archaeon]